MKYLKQTLILLMAGLMVLKTFAGDAPERPLYVLYLGPVEAGRSGRGGGFGGSRTNYIYLPGQTLAPEAIYFDHLTTVTSLTDAHLKHFDAMVQVIPDSELNSTQQKSLDSFKNAGNALIKYTERPSDSVLR